MMKVRESLEEKLKQKGLHGSIVSKINATKKNPLQPMNGYKFLVESGCTLVA